MDRTAQSIQRLYHIYQSVFVMNNGAPNYPQMTTVYIALGSNLGDPRTNLERAVAEIGALEGVRAMRVSPFYRTKAVGMEENTPDFLNGVLEAETEWEPRQLLDALLRIEKQMGRLRPAGGCASRIIDLDLLLYGNDSRQETSLELPHPRMRERWFALKPLADLAPDLLLPGGETVREALARVEEEDLGLCGSCGE
ncbi:MAG: 2-amino-4-hydroxy-6-hydroxymethyldihydropteridine diphosphokinase [Candidatus Omnitrophota bacterium]